MELRRARGTSSVRTEGGLLPADLLAKVAAADRDVPGLADADYALAAGDRVREGITRSWNRLVGSWAALTAARVSATDEHEPLTTPTRERWLLPLFEELGFGRLTVAARAVEIEGTAYPISHAWEQVPIHLVGFGIELDRRTPGVRGAAGAAPHALVQEYLNRSDEALWGIVSNGRLLRLLRDSTSLTRQAFVEFDLEAIFEGELFADFALLWSVCHRTRFDAAKPEECLLERWSKKAADDGTRALDKLRGGVERAIETLGTGFLVQPTNAALREALRSGDLDRQDYYRELLRLVYRLIFLFTAEDRRDETTGRELLLDPAAPDEAAERYRRHYSTARLRSLAGRRRGTRHPDLWVSLRRVIAALGGDGAPTLALPALGSFLFGPTACPHLDAAELRNEDLLDTVRALATIEEDRRLRLVDYRNLGAEELGGIYEGLLELHPRIEVDATPPRFTLGTAAGNERKATGSYYTPTSLITCLLDSALDPVVDEAVRGKDRETAERALLELAIVDPAAGSGHFVVAAAHRLAKRLASIRTDEGEPAPSAVRRALRDVIAHCIYAVDVNPMAVELCKVSLWLEALEPGRPLSFLDAHVKVGNSLLGTTPQLAAAGIPDAAYEALTGDDKAVARAWRDRNRQERDGQRALFEAGFEIPTDALAAAGRELEALPETDRAAVSAKSARHRALLGSPEYRRARLALDAWCAAFVAPKVPREPEITTAVVRTLAANPEVAASAIRDLVEDLAASFGFFHWELEFPAVFDRGGFDVVVGNPPWERVKLQEKEFFAERSPVVAGAKNAAERKRMIVDLENSDGALWRAFNDALRRADGESHYLRTSGVYPLAGRGDINTYAVFVERALSTAGARGWTGLIVPSAVATDETTSPLFRSMVDRRALRSLHDFRNSDAMFRDVGHRRFKFCLLTTSPAGASRTADLAFFAVTTSDLDDEARHFSLEPEDFRLLNPNSGTCPTFRSRGDAELIKSIYRRVPVLIREVDLDGNPWGLSFLAMFHMANDSGLFEDALGPERLPLYEAKMIHQFEHRYGDYALRAAGSQDTELPRIPADSLADPDYIPQPRYWVAATAVDARLQDPSRTWLMGWRDITNATNERAVIASVVPKVAVGHTLPLMFSDSACVLQVGLMSNLNTFVLDFVARQKLGGTHLTYGILKQLPILAPDNYMRAPSWVSEPFGSWIRRHVVELLYTSWSMRGFAADCGYLGPPFVWNAGRRERLKAELDAGYLHMYGLSADDASHVLDGFPIVREADLKRSGSYRTRDLILDAYELMAVATPERPFLSRLDPPPGDPRAAHQPGSGEEPGRWLPWSEVVNRSAAGLYQGPLNPARQGSSVPVGRAVSLAHRERTSASTPPPLDAPKQETLAAASDPPRAEGHWRPEMTVEPRHLLMGMRVRHRSYGAGTVLTVKPSGKGAELMVRFDVGGEKWIVLGYGVLEFADETSARGGPE